MIEIVRTYWLQLLLGYYPEGPLGGLALTLLLAVGGLLLTVPAALAMLCGLASPWKWLRGAFELFVFYVRGVPLVVHLLWAYLLIPMAFGMATPLWVVLMVVLVVFNGAYLSQAMLAGIEAVGAGQYDAARALGFTRFAALRAVVLPQALRNVLPSIVNQLVLLIKETALASVIGMHELSMEFQRLNENVRDHSADLFALLGLAYFLLCYPLTMLGRRLERKYRATAFALRESGAGG
ncbi:MAG TPA: amino acid ABC transporter permease [Ramlibacter sp.]|uniref:amino acid ABC transporter permease n=1 Tax=Ramlibacter sp. TaxID=1917967 RepID=UPI002C8D29EE|nr:amino acid ABC transporter permease [Ramlibacter sp.]HVZ43163.1 amino acid ABC transporter permease [Ramlibacter sp.]